MRVLCTAEYNVDFCKKKTKKKLLEFAFCRQRCVAKICVCVCLKKLFNNFCHDCTYLLHVLYHNVKLSLLVCQPFLSFNLLQCVQCHNWYAWLYSCMLENKTVLRCCMPSCCSAALYIVLQCTSTVLSCTCVHIITVTDIVHCNAI